MEHFQIHSDSVSIGKNALLCIKEIQLWTKK